VCGRSLSAWTSWFFGRPVQAEAAIEVAIALAERVAHPPTIAIGLTWACGLLYFGRNARETAHMARRLIDLATEQDLPSWRVAGVIFDGWARAEAGEGPAGIAQIREGLLAARTTTGTLQPLEPLYMLVLTDTYREFGQAEEGLRATDEALAMMAAMGVRIWLSEFYRLKGEFLLMRAPSGHASAEDSFREALAVAHEQGAQAWELRAATSIGRFLGRCDRRDEGRQTLGDVCGRFTEGFDTADLRDAKALLDSLSMST
jgi:adenylate cyclase